MTNHVETTWLVIRLPPSPAVAQITLRSVMMCLLLSWIAVVRCSWQFYRSQSRTSRMLCNSSSQSMVVTERCWVPNTITVPTKCTQAYYKQLYTQWPATCFSQPRLLPQGGKIRRTNTRTVKLLKYQNQSTCVQFLTLQKCNFHVSELCILPPWRWPRVWPKRVADHYVCIYICSICLCVFC